MRCPNCQHKLLQKSGTTMRLRTRGPILFTDAGCRGQCFWCKKEVDLPLRLDVPPAEDAPRFILRPKP